MAERVRDFFRTQQTDGVTHAGEAQRLEPLVQRAEVRRVLQSKLLRYLSAVGAAAARANTELGAQFRLPKLRMRMASSITWK